MKVIFVMILSLLPSLVMAVDYPYPMKLISKSEMNYLTPENTLFSIHSCHVAKDLACSDRALTETYLQNSLDDFEDPADRNLLLNYVDSVASSQIVGKQEFKDGSIIILVEDIFKDGSVIQTGTPFIQEKGLWKLTDQFASDDAFADFIYIIPSTSELYDGNKGNGETNQLLRYTAPLNKTIELPVGTSSYTLRVYYGKTVLPNTFKATLGNGNSKEDITTLFHPQAFSDEEVIIPLQLGKNILNLSINGKAANGHDTKDADSFVFTVLEQALVIAP
jgi:hypothetical protein